MFAFDASGFVASVKDLSDGKWSCRRWCRNGQMVKKMKKKKERKKE